MPARRATRRTIIGLAAATLALPFALPALSQSEAPGDAPLLATDPNLAVATFAGGCFWCVESDFDKVPGVVSTVSGYTGGSNDNPTYKDHTKFGHREAVQVTYDPDVVDYDTLLDVFWTSVDPTDAGGAFCDRGFSYTSAVYANSPEQLEAAKASAAEYQGKIDRPIVTAIEEAPAFWAAEDYHQDYYLKNPIRYKYYRTACRRDATVERVWGDLAYQGLEDSKKLKAS